MENENSKTLKNRFLEIIRTNSGSALVSIILLSMQTIIVFNLFATELIYYAMNCCIFILIYSILFVFVRRHTICFPAVSFVQLFLYYLDAYVYSSRGTHIQFNDVYCIGDALQVSGNYPLVMNLNILYVFLIVIMINFLIFAAFMKIEYRRFTEYRRSGFSFHIVIFSVSAVFVTGAVMVTEMPWFDINTYTSQLGLPAALISELKYSRVQKPNGYTGEKVERALLSYGTENATATDDVDIIVIMNEAWTDYSLTGNIALPKDPMPFYHSLGENCAKGRMLSSVYGGYTCNTEFEFLTGATMAFLPQYSSPYLQYIHGETDSVLKDECFDSYRKTAIHPFYAEEWRRKANYPFLGFDEFIAGENFSENYVERHNGNITQAELGETNIAYFGDDLEYVRTFVSDKECYRKVLKTLDNADGSSFIFAITVQNHGGYSYSGFASDRYTSANDIDQYLTLSAISDSALEYLIGELSQRERKTVLLMFGDHQPGWNNDDKSVLRNLGMNADDFYNYITPYLAWSNFDMEWDMPEITGANFLSLYLKENLGLPLTEFDLLRKAVSEEYTAISSNYIVYADGGEYAPISQLADGGAISDYKFVQYHMMFD